MQEQEMLIEQLRKLGAKCLGGPSFKLCSLGITLDDGWRGGPRTYSLLRELERVDRLSLEGAGFTDALLSQLVRLHGLAILQIQDTQITFRGLSQLRRAPDLVGVDLRQNGLPVSTWRSIGEADILWLHVSRDAPPFDDYCPQDSHLRNLLSLRVSGKRIDDRTMMHIGQFDAVRELSLASTQVTDAGLTPLSELAHLVRLDLSSTCVDGSNVGFASLGTLRSITELILNDTGVSDRALQVIAQMTTLESLELNHTAVTDQGIEQLENMPCLRSVSLVDTHTSDACAASLAKIQSLITSVDRDGNVILFRRQWLASDTGRKLPYWAKSHGKTLYLWTGTNLEVCQLSLE